MAAPLPPTADVSTDPSTSRRGIWWRRGFLTLLALLVVAALFGFLGVRSRTVSAATNTRGLDVDVTYAQIARAGLSVPFSITVHRDGGFDDDVVVSVSSDYLDLFDRNAIDPQPSSETTTRGTTVWTFDRPLTDTFVVSLDMTVQEGRHFGRSGTVAVLTPSRRTLASTTVKTWLAP